MKLPVIQSSPNYFPQDGFCPWCRRKIGEPHSFVELGGGALLKDRKSKIAGPSDQMEGLLTLTWHGAHDDGEGEDRDFDAITYLVEFVRGGFFGIYFCSTTCLRAFFNFCVDELDRDIATARAATERSRLEEEQGQC